MAGFAGAYWERRLNVTTNVAMVTNYLSFGGETVALVTETSTSPGALTTLWQLKDHLGSTTTLLDASSLLSGARKSYDVWGKRRHVTGEDDTTNSIVSASSRDFTGHEFLEELRLVHMGGRIYDPVVARFLSPDPFVQDPFNLQNLNRYSYVLNNPLAYTDPDGFFFKSISKAFGKLQRFFQKNPIAALAVGLASAWALGPMGLGWIETLSIQSAIVAGSVSGALTDGLRGAIFGAVAGAVTYGIGELGLGFLKEAEFLGKAALHGTAQGALAEARGGEFGPAFLAASFAHAAAAATSAVPGLNNPSVEAFAARTVTAAIIGGTASVIGGGKFQNGAATAAFVALYNCIAHECVLRYMRGEGGTSVAPFSKLGADQVTPLDSRLVRDLIAPGAPAGVHSIVDEIQFRVPNFPANAVYGNVRLQLTGTLGVGESSWTFYGRLTALRDIHDYDPKPWGVRSQPAEVSTRIGAMLPGRPFEIQFSGGRTVWGGGDRP